jgi:hypothetical protein
MMRKALWLVLFALVAVTAAGCAKPPTVEIDAASEAMDAAQAAGAPDYAPEAWAKAQASEAELEAEITAQKDAFALSRSYEQTKNLAQATKSAAETAAAEALTGKETAKNEATQSIETAKALRQEVDQLLTTAPTGKGAVADLAALRADTGSTEESIRAAEAALAAGQYREARAKAEAAIQSLEAVKAEIESAKLGRGGRA